MLCFLRECQYNKNISRSLIARCRREEIIQMHAINLYTLTRTSANTSEFSRLLQALSGRRNYKHVSMHEASSLCTLVSRLTAQFAENPVLQNRMELLDGFWFSYSSAHISKEFDLLKFSSDAASVLNIELKSEAVPEERIRRQLEQNRYYLANVSRTIYSFTYVMETDTLYQLKENQFFGTASFSELAAVLMKTRFQTFIAEGLDRYFRASDYLISPVSTPERLLQGKYFLTNQQWEFRRRILDLIRENEENRSSLPGAAPVITLTGSAGTGKTLLLFDLALALSKKKEVLFLHGGPLREGHHIINSRLRNVVIRSGTAFEDPEDPALWTGSAEPVRYACVLVDEANRLSAALLRALLQKLKEDRIPAVLAYDPYSIRSIFSAMEDAEDTIAAGRTHAFSFSGNIRINRPVFAFMWNMFSLKEKTPHADYSCVDVLYAGNTQEEQIIADYYQKQGFAQIAASSASLPEDEIVAQEYDRILVIMDDTFYYDAALHLCKKGDDNAALSVLYEALTRTRERLTVLITGNPDLFARILQIRMP